MGGLKKELENGWDIDAEFDICQYIKEPPLNLALYYNKLKVVDFLIEQGANLNLKGNPSITAAADECSYETIALLVKHGADIHAVNRMGSNAIHRALINKRCDLIPRLIALGLDVTKDGTILRSAVDKREQTVIQLLLDQKIDVNYHTPDQVYPYNPTAVCVAAANDDFDTVKKLVEHGADVTIKDNYGNRPFTKAQENKNQEMMDYLKTLEPAEWHNEEERLLALKSYKLPQKLIEFLRQSERRIAVENNPYISYIVFSSLVDCKEITWHGCKYLDLLSEVDNYPNEGFLVWYPKNKSLASVDFEHEELKILDFWDDFIENPSNTINKIFQI